MPAAPKAIWIDLDNSPHVPLFAPVIKHYRQSGVEVVLTARDHAQTLELLDLKGFKGTYTALGRHYGKGKLNKVSGLMTRTRQLVSYIKQIRSSGTQIAVALSHGSRSMVLAAWWLRLPVITMYDYEFTETLVFNRFSDKVLVPDRIPDEVLDEIGLAVGKRAKYPGIKEELYVRGFTPAADFKQTVLSGLTGRDVSDSILAVLRPPATTANYHSDKSEVLFDDILHFLLGAHNVVTVVAARTREQAAEIEAAVAGVPDSETKCLVLKEAVDGLALAYSADLLISGGGTMNREAALLGVPVYSIFAGRQGALDRQMEAEGLITFIRDARDLSKIRVEKRVPGQTNALTGRVESFVIEQIGRYLN